MDFKTAVNYENYGLPVTYQGRMYFVIGHNELLGTVTIRENSTAPMFTIPKEIKPEELI